MELRHLRYFVMVAEERHLTRAAARLNMQQPPLSQQIRALEEELGFDLFKRHPKGVDLTAGGHVFLQEAQDILTRVKEGADKAARAAHGIEGQLTVGFTSSAATHPLIPRIVRAYRERFPGVAVSLKEGSAQQLTDATIDGSVDVGILRAPVSRHQRIQFHRLLNEEMFLTLPVGHRLLMGYSGVGEAPAISLKDLADEQFILVRRPGAPGMYANLITACQNAGFNPSIAFEVERMLTNVSLVAAGAGVSIVPASMRDVHKESVVYCPIANAKPRLHAPITLVCRSFNQLPPLQNFIGLSRELSGRSRGAR
ncbi:MULTISPECIES: LysR substrate-binding domain-containing protein [unclassified Pseudomonas]|uniref:LysR substrate-binding domain-containing protein n=1 Tax=unclassified Pseudomonas TaxID=196821 RepID=UPI000D3AF6C6|nr:MULTISPECIES: LysR substrate-binding domain-containing protein [unclassified Pseudomonas]RAU49574.1 LysR family transcriptional regulator [Pseudomonas sp. RIT 409]RAU55687.1 LysR family transcriptional regulator [Pseudomonas sp. RIT 412]